MYHHSWSLISVAGVPLHTKNRCAEITHNRCVILAQFGMLNVSAKIIITQLLCCFYTPVCYFTN